MFLSTVSLILILLTSLMNVAFITLFERKLLSISQSRKGPNKVSFVGILQPISDAVKLFLKQKFLPYSTNFILFMISPMLAMVIMLVLWTFMSFDLFQSNFTLSMILFLMVLSVNIYPLMITGWASNSKYSLIGAIRAIAQTISYEVSLALIMLSFISISFYMAVWKNCSLTPNVFFTFISSPLMILWLISCVAETNRTPFDFAEGESELVSGFNTEYASGLFALIFMAEYGMILLLSIFSSSLFFAGKVNSYTSVIMMLVLSFLWMWLRATFPRYRYDMLMNLAWKSILPLTISILMLFNLMSIWVNN